MSDKPYKKQKNSTTLRCAERGTHQIGWLQSQIDPLALNRHQTLTLILDWACTPEGLKTLREHRVTMITRGS